EIKTHVDRTAAIIRWQRRKWIRCQDRALSRPVQCGNSARLHKRDVADLSVAVDFEVQINAWRTANPLVDERLQPVLRNPSRNCVDIPAEPATKRSIAETNARGTGAGRELTIRESGAAALSIRHGVGRHLGFWRGIWIFCGNYL